MPKQNSEAWFDLPEDPERRKKLIADSEQCAYANRALAQQQRATADPKPSENQPNEGPR
jgi:hypothetical protein